MFLFESLKQLVKRLRKVAWLYEFLLIRKKYLSVSMEVGRYDNAQKTLKK